MTNTSQKEVYLHCSGSGSEGKTFRGAKKVSSDKHFGSPARDRAGVAFRLVLASGSPRRREILRSTGIPFEVVAPRDVDETAARGRARDVAKTLAKWKAEAVLGRLRLAPGYLTPELRVLGADTVVAVGEGDAEEILGKPESEEDGRRMLRRLSSRAHFVFTGVAVATPDRGTVVDVEQSEVRFRRLEPHDIEWYLQTGEPRDKAGAYGIQGHGERWVEGFLGCFLNIVGLPLVRTLRLLGVAPSSGCPCPCADHPLQRGRPGCM
jgi:septum formation protein